MEVLTKERCSSFLSHLEMYSLTLATSDIPIDLPARCPRLTEAAQEIEWGVVSVKAELYQGP